MPTNTSLEKLIRESMNLRDHLLHVEGQDSTDLGAALQPIDRQEDLSIITDAQITALSMAFQTSYDRALKSVDGYTLNEVLKGRSPHVYKARISGSFVLMALGVMLVAAALHFTYWSNRTNVMLVQAQEFSEFDHFQNVMKLVELENYFDTIKDQNQITDLEPQLVYLEGLDLLSAHYTEEWALPVRMRKGLIDLNPVRSIYDSTRRNLCTGAVDGKPTGWSAFFISCPMPLPAQLSNAQAVKAITETVPTQTPTTDFVKRLDEIETLKTKAMEAAGRQRQAKHVTSQYDVANMAQQLKELLTIVHRWALPIIYGALGSIVYCMWRILNPNVAPLGFIYSVMRTAFAGLAALTLSMLFVPSNLLSGGIELNRPLIYLISFIFGYSIEAFVSTLNLLNTYLTTSLTPKPKRGGG